MRKGEELWFSPNWRFTEIAWEDREKLIDQFYDRVEGYFFKPAETLDNCEDAFAQGVICVTCIDFLAKYMIGPLQPGQRFKKWLRYSIPDFRDQGTAQYFYRDFRNALVHAGKIDNCGQFNYDIENLVSTKNSVMIVNPRLLLGLIRTVFKKYTEKLKQDWAVFTKFKSILEKEFYKDYQMSLMEVTE